MALWTHSTASQATGGAATATWQATRVEIDSRRVQPGDLFVAIKGERFDGHAFVADALARGAAAAIVSTPQESEGSYLIVDDTMKALNDLARFNRARSNAKIIGVTGSVGKTSTKEMLKLALSAHGKTYATTGNFNNHIGTPLNLANLPPDAAFAVMEMGMNHAGEIAQLTRMVRPHVAVITNIEAVHLEFFPSLDAIADAKAEIFEGMEAKTAVLNADNPYLNRLKMVAAKQGVSHVLTFGETHDSDIRLIAYQPVAGGCEVDASALGELVSFRLGAIGRHWAKTSLSVLAVAMALGLDPQKTAQALAQFGEVEGRGKCSKITVPGGHATLIDDSYNASPASMRSAFAKTQEVWESLGKKGRKLAALGDMLELGAQEHSLHSALAQDLARLQFDAVYTAGARMKHLYDALPVDMRGAHTASADELPALLAKSLQRDDVLLIKGSHGSHMYKVAHAMLALSTEEKNAL